MSWLKIDTGLRQNPKWLALTRPQRAIWIEALCYVAEYKSTSGELPDIADTVVPGLRQARATYRRVGLLDPGDIVHDWLLHGPSSTEDKVKHYLQHHPNATANQVASQIRGNRNLVLATVRQYRDTNGTSTQPVPDTSTTPVPDTGIRVRVPSRPVPLSQEPSVTETAPKQRRTHEEPEPGHGDGPDDDIDFNSILKEM